ncbi:hypothetical protein ACJJI4_07790 [Microbulbifer sp. TRSA002]|uniref:hypothetical protein n=1 Tax=Microbulbifer sp. TRSA002 TaxID=3243382 RepID=UPI00403999BE
MEKEVDPKIYGVTTALFNEWRSPRLGDNNPQRVRSNVWEWLFHSRLSGYASTKKMNGPSPFDEGPTWSFDRFGQSINKLPDGRIVYIGGEHEDHYDPDFYIYNDVVVETPEGRVEFYCYRNTDFPPTDFHSATLVDEKIFIIGNLGYPAERRLNDTQVYVLDINNFKINKVETLGESPGWIHQHNAVLSLDKKSITITNGLIDRGDEYSLRENIDDWRLNLENSTWERLTERKWPRWELRREDKSNNHIYDIRQALWSYEAKWQDSYDKAMQQLESEMGFKVDVRLVKNLYEFDIEHEPIERDEEEYNVYWLYVEGVRIRFIEEWHCIQVVIEGSIPDTKLLSIKEQLISKLTHLEKAYWILEEC